MSAMPVASNIELLPLAHDILCFLRQSKAYTAKQTLREHFPDIEELNKALRNLKDLYLVDYREDNGAHPASYRPRKEQGWEALAECMGLDQVPKLNGKLKVRSHKLEA